MNKRLTRKINDRYFCAKRADEFDGSEFIEANQKLGKLEDIEEKIGIDLVTLFRILERFDKTIRNGKHGISYVSFPDGTTFATDMAYVEDFIKRIKKLIGDYGKTWGFTKEELL